MSRWEPAIHRAVERGDRAQVEAILSTDPLQVHAILAPNTPDQPLHIAAWQNRVKIARLLIAAGADLNALGLHGWTPLHYAAHHGSPTVAQVLINSGADINQKDEVGFTPLFKATRSREPEAARIEQMLVKAGAIVDLNTAVCLGDLQRIHQILAADPDAVQHAPFPLDLVYDAVIAINGRLGRECPVGDDWTPEKAQNVLIKYRPLLDMLIEHGADIDGIGFAGRPPLFVAVQISTLSISKDAVLVSLIFAVLSKPLILHHNRLNPACPIGRDICTSERRDVFVYPSTTLMFENSNARRRRWSEGAEHVRERRFMFSMLCPKWIKSRNGSSLNRGNLVTPWGKR